MVEVLPRTNPCDIFGGTTADPILHKFILSPSQNSDLQSQTLDKSLISYGKDNMMTASAADMIDSFDFDVFSTSLDDTLQVLEEEGMDNASVKDIMFDSLQRRNSIMTKSISSDTASLTSSHGDYDIPCEESTTLSSKTQKPIGQIKNTFLPDNISNIAPSRVPPQPSIQTSAPPCYFIDFEKSKIRPIQITSPLHQAAMINSNLCYESPKVPGRPIVKNSALDTYSPKPNISSKKVISQNALADYHQQRHFAGGFNATPVPEVRQQRSPVLNLNSKVKKQRSKSSSGVSSKKNFHANNPYSEDSDASSCITQSTVRCVYKQNQDFRQQPNRADLFALSKSRRVNSNISNLGKSSLTDESESTRSVFTDVREVRNSSWFSRDKKKRIRRMLKMYNNDNSNLHYNHRNSSCTKVVLAEL